MDEIALYYESQQRLQYNKAILEANVVRAAVNAGKRDYAQFIRDLESMSEDGATKEKDRVGGLFEKLNKLRRVSDGADS